MGTHRKINMAHGPINISQTVLWVHIYIQNIYTHLCNFSRVGGHDGFFFGVWVCLYTADNPHPIPVRTNLHALLLDHLLIICRTLLLITTNLYSQSIFLCLLR